MPFIAISHSGNPLSDAQKQALFTQTTTLMAEVMGKNPIVTAVRIDEFPPQNWAIHAINLVGSDEIATHMEINVTEGTNSADEKAQMIAKASDMLKTVLGPVAQASYIIIRDVDAGSWGYDGTTQAARAASKR